MKHAVSATLSVVISFATAAHAQTLAPELQPAPGSGQPVGACERFGFAFRSPCRVPATRVIDRPKGSLGGRALTTFDVVVGPAGANAGAGLLVRIENMKLVELDGQAPTGDAGRIASASLEFTLAPPFLIAPDGHFTRAIDIDASIDATLARSPAPEQSKAALAAAMKSPLRREGLEPRAKLYWKGWSENWAGLQIGPGREAVRTDTIEVQSEHATAPLHVSRLGPVAGAPNLVLLDATQAVVDDDARRLLTPVLSGAAGANAPPPIPPPKSARIDYRWTIAIERGSGRVHRVRLVTTFEADGKKLIASGDTALDWSRAVGCKTAP
jgi:hypothetical protein